MFDADADALGWGKENMVQFENLIKSEKPLKIVRLKIITVTECKRVLKRLKKEITIKHICVKEMKKGENIYAVSKRSLSRLEEFWTLKAWIKNTFILGRQWWASGSRR